ncbi:MAG: 3-isopropylmalate dehydratase small subunit [Alphaproteobacteria bacterium]|nr:3-isopropylmalate dehydratase small subunit [Alphaproteobacteria bacterium]
MHPFTALTAVAAPLPIDNVDTDMIIPKQFLKTIKRTGLKEGLFYEMRYTPEGARIDDFVLHQPPYDHAQILVSGANFGCGSSREHAPWALLDFGIRCIVAQSFADIFFNNCFKNGMLPIVLPKEEVDALMSHAQTRPQMPLHVDLQRQEIGIREQSPFHFEIEPFRKQCLLNGLDDIALTLRQEDAIVAYENYHREQLPWLYA